MEFLQAPDPPPGATKGLWGLCWKVMGVCVCVFFQIEQSCLMQHGLLGEGSYIVVIY